MLEECYAQYVEEKRREKESINLYDGMLNDQQRREQEAKELKKQRNRELKKLARESTLLAQPHTFTPGAEKIKREQWVSERAQSMLENDRSIATGRAGDKNGAMGTQIK